MAGKQHNHPMDNTGSSFLAQFPPRISLGSPVLASALDLPPQPHISCSVYTAAADSVAADQLDKIDQARRRICQENESHIITEALLPSVRITRDPLALYVFALGSGEVLSVSETALQTLTLDGLVLVDSSRFSVAGLYPCSISCTAQPIPCPTCIKSWTNPSDAAGMSSTTSRLSSACLLPRKSLRRLHSQFLEALRDRLINNITSVRQSKPGECSSTERPAIRLNDGFLINSPPPSSPSEWGTGWDQRSLRRTLTHCQLQIELASSCVFIRPILRPTCYLPLSSVLPLPVGTPVMLLPHGVTAYYLNIYTGPVGSLAAQFDDALLGLGARNWKGLDGSKAVSYVIIWLAVQNKQGEDKGIRAIWPASLCVAFSSTATYIPPSLPYIPDLPAQLQSSPPAVAAQISASVTSNKPSLRAFTPSVTASSLPSPLTETHLPHGSQSRHTTPQPMETQHEINSSTTPQKRPLPSPPHSPTSDSLRAFKTLTLVNRNIRQIAGEVSGYVDAVVKERERERERLRREREGVSSRIGSSPAKPEEKSKELEQNKATPVPVTNPQVICADMTKVALSDQESLHRTDPGSVGHNGPGIGIAHGGLGDAIALAQETVQLLPAPKIIPSTSHRAPSLEATSSDVVGSDSTNPPAPPDPIVAESNISFETFGAFDNDWNHGSGEFMNLDMGIDNFDYSMNGDDGGFGADDTFGAFTEDDFNFFDAPAARLAASASTPTAGAVASLSLAGTNTVNPSMHPSGPGPPSLNGTQGLLWLSQGVAEGFTPRSLDTPGSIPPPPDLIPSTPTLTPPSQSLPVTPTVMLSDQLHSAHGRKGSLGSSSLSMFDPIPFAEVHRLSDGKYARGKFALSTPPDEEERTRPIPIRHPFPRRCAPDWKSSYTAVTDPRVGIIRRLKRKRCQKEEDGRSQAGRMSPAWLYEREEWMSSSPQDVSSDVEMDEALSASEDEVDELPEDERDIEIVSRAHTPPPSYLPVGPTLIATNFCHAYLLPMSSTLRPPGASLANTSGTGAGPMSVPTPVSPAAVLGDASAKSKALEDAAQILIKELIENCIWEASWRAGALTAYAAKKVPTHVWQVDAQRVKQLLCSVGFLRVPLDLRAGLSDDGAGRVVSMQELDHPLLAIGKSDTIVQVLPSALRFWEKLGLTPRAGKKDIEAFVLFEGGEDKEEQLAVWLDRVSASYDAQGFGRHSAGRAPSCVRNGLVPIHLDAIRKTLSSFIASLTDPESPTVFYIILPAQVINLNSQVLRRVLYAIRKAAKSSQTVSRVFQLVPEPFVMGALDNLSMNHSGVELLASSLYDRLRVPSRRSMARSLIPNDDDNVCALFQEPAFILARPIQRKAKFLREAHASTLDVLDRHMFLHVAYLTSSCGKWLFMAAIDQVGSAHDICALLVPSDAAESFLVSSVWNFALGMAMKANVEWHITVAKFGFMSASEFDAWPSHLEPERLTSHILPPLRVTLLVAETDNRWHFLSPERIQSTRSPVSPSRAPKIAPGTGFCDVSATTYMLKPGVRRTLSVPSASHLFSGSPCILDPEDEKIADELGMRPLSTISLVRVPAGSDYTTISMLHLHVLGAVQSPNSTAPADEEMLREVATNYHDLSVLGHERWRLNANPILPFHLAALEIMQLALDKGDLAADQ